MKAPTFAEKMTETNVVLPEEVIPDLDADHIILLLSNGTWEDAGIAEALKDRMENPLWKNVPAVKNGKVYTVERSYWQTGAIMANGKKWTTCLSCWYPDLRKPSRTDKAAFQRRLKGGFVRI